MMIRPVAPAGVWAVALSLTFACARVPAPPPPQPSDEAATPATDVFLYRFGQFARGSAVFNITNRTGYDNQPFWDGNDRVLYTTQTGGQYDISEIDFKAGTNRRVTTTPESEYSAALTPDGDAISVVRVERDSAQRLWRFPRDGGAPTVILKDIKPVGYYAWLDSTVLALYVLGSGNSPNTLQIADTRTGRAQVVTTNIGRSLQRMPRSRRASYLHRVGDKWVLESVDPTPRPAGGFDIDTIAVMPDSAEFVVWRSPTEAFTAAGSRILRLRLPNTSWVLVEDLSARGIRRISRLALSSDASRLALVADDQPPPR